MMTYCSESLTFTVPISLSDRTLAEQFRFQHNSPEKAKQVYLNTLAVSAVKFYLCCMGVETNWSASLSWNSAIQTVMNVADLEVIGQGKIECLPVLPGEKVIHIPPEVCSDRIGYVAVQLNESLREATLLGFIKMVTECNSVPLSELRSLEELIVQLSEAPEQEKQPIHLSKWLMNVVDVGWQRVEAAELAFGFRSAEQTLAENLADNLTISVQQGILLDLGRQPESKPIALRVGLIPTSEQEINIFVKVCPTDNQKYLPEELKIMVLDDLGTAVMQATARSTKSIQLNFSSELGEHFSIKVALGNVNFIKFFTV
ncbi:DUF1822 family protein [Nostoc sp. FACHB-892]|uniref:DUF1822 family protein n=1 Tax=Nostoc sp. FACHB-892 TaxID=2692843 RepID=UPI001684E4FB|nr:DUF1822 family protein [Nostoc sp. FACHB-892]MBD2728863.1 DUF1822 family protein [Nostoc sp. FACHB-892]